MSIPATQTGVTSIPDDAAARPHCATVDQNPSIPAITEEASPQDHAVISTSAGLLDRLHGIYELSSGDSRMVPMEGLRGLAVLMVFFVHFDALFGNYGRPSALLWWPSQLLGLVGNAGVDLFFVLSGYLIYGGLIRHRSSLLRFLWRRVERIYPTFLAVFALYLVLSFVFPGASKLHGVTRSGAVIYILQNILLLPGIFDIKPIITVAWSLSYEFFFYISLPLLIRTVRMWTWSPRWRVWFFAGLGCAYLAFSFSVQKAHVRALMFVVGILLYEALSDEAFRRMLSRRGEAIAILLFLGIIPYVYFLEHASLFSGLPGWLAGRSITPGVAVYEGPYKTIGLSVSIFWFVAYCVAFDGSLKRVFSWVPLRYLGNMSYSYYLVHGVTLQGVAITWAVLAPLGGSKILLFLAALPAGFAATWITSTGLFLFVEKPFSLQRKRAHARSQRPLENS